MKNILGIAKMLNRHGLTALFLAFIALLGLWNLPAAGQTGQEALSPEPSAQEDGSRGGGFLDAWDRLVDALDTFYLEDLRGRYGFIEGNGLVKRLAGFSTCNETVRLANGYLERLDNNFDVEDTAESLTALNEYCWELGIPFLCVLAPSKVCKYDPGLPLGVPDEVNPGADRLVEMLRKQGVDVVDLRAVLHEEGLDHDSLFFQTDHHWTSEGAFWGYQKVAEYLNQHYGYHIDERLMDRSNFETVNFPDKFLGSYGKRTGKYFGGVDDISVIMPDFPTQMKMEAPDRGIVREGSFSQAILDWSQIEDSWYYDEGHIPYAVYTGDDYNLLYHTNEEAEEDKKILFLKDSFVRPVASFLNLGVRRVEAIDLRIEPKISVKEYLEENRPDIVIFMCSIWALKDYNLIDFGL